MSTQRQLRRGTNAENEAFTGAVAETVYDTTKKRLVNHDGSTAGGFPVPNFIDIQNGAFTCADGSGTDTITLSLEKAPTAYAEYQSFTFKPQNNNTGATTLNVNSLGAKDIKKDDGTGTLTALEADDLKANIPVTVIYDGTQFIAQLGGGGSAIDIQEFTSSGTWTKPPKGTFVLIELIGAGGSGGSRNATGSASGGGGGAYGSFIVPIYKLSSTETVTIGAGGASVSGDSNGNAGGETYITIGGTVISTTYRAKGGGAGRNATSGATPGDGGQFVLDFAITNGGSGGSGSSLNGAGGGGSKSSDGTGDSPPSAGGTSWGSGGNGGDSSGGARTGTDGLPVAQNGFNYGGGGGAAVHTSTSGGTSGAGANGFCRLTVF